MPYKLNGEITNRCSSHGNKMLYNNAGTLMNVILKTQQEKGIKLTWYKCEVHGGFHLTKWENKQN